MAVDQLHTSSLTSDDPHQFFHAKKLHEKGHIDRYINRYIDGHRDSMKESAKGRFFEKNSAVLCQEELELLSPYKYVLLANA